MSTADDHKIFVSACRKVSSKQRMIVGPSQHPFRAPRKLQEEGKRHLFGFVYVCTYVCCVCVYAYSTRKGGLYLKFIQRIASAPLAQSEPISTALAVSKAPKRTETIVSSLRFRIIQYSEHRFASNPISSMEFSIFAINVS